MKRTEHLLVVILIICVLSATIALGTGLGSPSVSIAQGHVWIENPNAEGGFRYVDGVGELQVANGWHPWYYENPGESWFRPEYKAETRDIGRGRVYEGAYAQKLFTTYAKHDAGVYQEVRGITPGQWYEFSAIGWQWSSQYDNPDESRRDGKCSLIAGINPWGDARALYRTTVWGQEALNVYDRWTKVTVTAQAWTDKIVVFVRHVCEYPVKHNDVYFESFDLRTVSHGSEPLPTRTCAPLPTHTPYPTYTPAPTCTPTPPGQGGSCPTLEDIRGVVREELRNLEVEIK